MKIDAATIQKYLSPSAYKDLDTFIEELPLRAGKYAVIAGIAAWIFAGLSVTYVFMQANHIMSLRADILKAESLKPTVPVLTRVPVENAQLDAFAKKLSALYPQIVVTAPGGALDVRAPTTDRYGAFREAVGHAFNGGKGWRLSVQSLCVGRECKANGPVSGSFKVYRLQVDKPAG